MYWQCHESIQDLLKIKQRQAADHLQTQRWQHIWSLFLLFSEYTSISHKSLTTLICIIEIVFLQFEGLAVTHSHGFKQRLWNANFFWYSELNHLVVLLPNFSISSCFNVISNNGSSYLTLIFIFCAFQFKFRSKMSTYPNDIRCGQVTSNWNDLA